MKNKINISTIIILIIMSSCSTTNYLTPAERYANTHKDKNFRTVLDNNRNDKLESANEELKDAKSNIKINNKISKQEAKIRVIKNN